MSNVIKYTHYVSLDDVKLVERRPAFDDNAVDPSHMTQEQRQELTELTEIKEQILNDAETFAEEQVRAAMSEASAIRERAQEEIQQWWNERRQDDDELQNKLKDEGFSQGYQDGLVRAEEELRQQYSEMLQEASQILEQAYISKQQIIQEAEPFLIEMSCAISEKIIARQLTVESSWVIELIQSVLARRKEKGIITLCIAPAHFSNIQDAREELLLHIDSQAELQIIPDPSVHDRGCVIRSSFGSIDARIDTQLNEIKNALQQLAVRNEGE
ncbi:FliH/SctL family protein [Paenibacillus xerothermodurans]|uniref:Flagellar assembly protein FliH n=1 Tax=Paenibacillus xerothermodurans TaxID=1977292 RepID=A0A2W1NES8_PAEXE|nr:FliH/SctL family protein [Paenibacillus xerothermodurans]PZE22454.1 flagellar assembly protein FliH [Paenibacillus xerothermodurans]